jgi:RNA polymerase sigma-70 factor, ECF subfamily
VTNLHRSIEAEIPRLKRYARVLTRDVLAADDLVQDCLARALGKLHLWQQGSDMRAWLFAILHNEYVNQVRHSVRQGAAVALSEAGPSLAQMPEQTGRLELHDLGRALAALPDPQRRVLLLIGVDGLRYEEAAETLGVPVGTVRSRLARGRIALHRLTDANRIVRRTAAAGERRGRAAGARPAAPRKRAA